MFIKCEGCGHGYLLAFLVKEDIFAHPWPRPGHPINFDRLENKTDYDFESVFNSWCKPAGNTKAIFFGVVKDLFYSASRIIASWTTFGNATGTK